MAFIAKIIPPAFFGGIGIGIDLPGGVFGQLLTAFLRQGYGMSTFLGTYLLKPKNVYYYFL